MKNIVLGILAHVDAGKTTTSEAMLYASGRIRNLGRVDHKDAYLDNNLIERQRGITIFSKQAVFDMNGVHINLLDTPGHIDFSAEMERTLSVLDYAILVISGPDMVQAHTITLWSLLKKYNIPTFIWVNKEDLMQHSRKDVISDLATHFGSGFSDFNNIDYEKLAENSEESIEEYLSTNSLELNTIQKLIAERKVFPCYFGSALRLEGTGEFFAGLCRYIKERIYGEEFGAKVFKITHDTDGKKLSWIKLCSGKLSPRDQIGEDKITQIRVYSGAKFESVNEAVPGNIYAVLGLTNSYAGEGLGTEKEAAIPSLEPVLTYTITPPDGIDSISAMKKLSSLNEEDPMLRIVYNSRAKEIQAQLMGEVQIDVLKELIADRYGMNVSIEKGRIVYKETIAAPSIGIGHFEPLRHYAEVHLLLEPLQCGSGLEFSSAVSTDDLDLNWQRLVLNNLAEKEHLGVLTGSTITDIKISIIAGRAHLKHTEGGDFRQAVYRAVRQGLMSAKNILLEPYYDYTLEVPSENIGRAISDLKSMACDFDNPIDLGMTIELKGRGPVSTLQNYQTELLSYTRGRGRLSCSFAGYYPCHNAEEVTDAIGYIAERDTDNPSDSVFCSHGAGVNVKWNKVPEFAHLDSGIEVKEDIPTLTHSPKLRSGNIDFDEKELEAIMAREFGEIRHPQIAPVSVTFSSEYQRKKTAIKKDYLIVDGYNILHAFKETKELAASSIDAARNRLLDILINYRAYKGSEVCVVFDGYALKGNLGSKSDVYGLHTVFTKEGESADGYIEALLHEIGKNYSVRVATNDGLIQQAALRAGVIRMTASELEYEVNKVLGEISGILNMPKEKITLADIAKVKK